MSMRLKVIQKKEEIAKGDGVAKMDPESIKQQLEALHDAMIDIHKEYVASEECSEAYASYINQTHDQNYKEENPDFVGLRFWGTLKEAYKDPDGGFVILPFLTRVIIDNVSVTGLVTFHHRDNKKKKYRLYADELRNYGFAK